jgi:hypothetical protein
MIAKTERSASARNASPRPWALRLVEPCRLVQLDLREVVERGDHLFQRGTSVSEDLTGWLAAVRRGVPRFIATLGFLGPQAQVLFI